MAESTTPPRCTDDEFVMARNSGLLTARQGTNAFDEATHRFADAVRLAESLKQKTGENNV